jgi:hypothetical protein
VFTDSNAIRKAAIWLFNRREFEPVLLFCVILNSIILALADYSHVDGSNAPRPVGWRNRIVIGSEPVFTSIFVFEACVKIVTLGFLMPKASYLKDVWNVLDFGIVVAA